MLLSLLVLAGCSSNPVTAPPPTIPPAQPAVSPPVSQRPAGAVRPLKGRPAAATFDAGTSRLVVLSPGADPRTPATVTVFGAGQDPPRVIALPGPATALTGDGRGNAYLSAHGGYFVVDLIAGHITRVDVDGAADTEFTAIARRADSKMVLGSADGAVYTLASEARIFTRTKLFARVDSIVVQGDTAVVLDRGQTSVTTVGPDGAPRYALRAGQGATTLAADPRGLVLVADTRGGQLLVYGVDPLILRQAYPVREAPYGLVGSSELVWVSQTATNTVIGYDLATGIPIEKVRYPTVRQPNALAFDDTSGTLYVVSGVGAGVQVIAHAAGPR
ncbi:MAG: YncE family protein [Mycobacterium sp.]